MQVSVITPNYNGKTLLEKNFPRIVKILSQAKNRLGLDIEYLVIDDASTDESKKYLQDINKLDHGIQLHILYNERNLGFSPTINKAVKHTKGTILFLLNSDVIPEHDFLDTILPHFKDEKCFAVGCMDKSPEKNGVIERGRGIGEWRRGMFVHKRGDVSKTNTLWVSGGSGAFRRSLWEKFNGFNEIYKPYYWEDIDLSYRALKSGYSLVFENRSIVTHVHEEGSIKTTQSRKKILTTAYRNHFIFTWVNISDYDFLFSHFLWLPIHLSRALLRRDITMLLGFFKAFFLLPNVIQSRSSVKRSFRKTDKEILSQFTL